MNEIQNSSNIIENVNKVNKIEFNNINNTETQLNHNNEIVMHEDQIEKTEEKLSNIPESNDKTQKFPKKKYAIIHGYCGLEFFGNQK